MNKLIFVFLIILSFISTNIFSQDQEKPVSAKFLIEGLERDGKLKPGGKYYYTRNKSTLVAFSIGGNYKAGHGGFKVIGGHTDSPNLKVKPRSKRSANNAKSIQLGAECYGGG